MIKGDAMTKKKTKTIRATPKKLSISAPTPIKSDLYDVDFYKWTKAQVNLLKKKQLSELDIANLIDEVESLGISDKRSLRSYIANLFLHLLKMDYQSERKCKSWQDSIYDSLDQIESIILDSPSFKNLIPRLSEEAYELARKKACRETNLDLKTFPEECPGAYKEYLKFGKK